MNPKVDWFFSKTQQWQQEFALLRSILLDSKAIGETLTEELKWGHPCYTINKKNIVLIHGFKEYCALLFFKGAILKDARKIMIQQTENVQSARQVRFHSIQDIIKMKAALKTYIREAIEVENAGLKVPLKKATDYAIPQEFQKRLDKSASLKKAFLALTPGRQRGYILYFSQAKQSKTRDARVEKYVAQIIKGKGLDD